MRTLKKVLALTVVLATVFSLTAFAAFTDADQINESCQDDINLMNALNVMVGDAEGTFRPNGTISRAEAAKMVYVVRNGGVDDKAAGWTGMKVFSDVPAGAWYEGYVNYCASLGIIAGVGGNKFNPDGAVTGVELAKMLLVVAGYKPDVQGYTGANWSLNVINDAQQANMFEGYAIAFSASAPRQWAAKLFSNAILKTQMALYLGGELVNGAAFMANAETVGEKYFSLKIATGELTKIPHVDLDSNPAALDINNNTSEISAIAGDTTTTSGEFVFNTSADLLSQEVDVVYKETSSSDNGLDVKDTVYSIYATGTSKVYDTTKDAITLAADSNNNVTIKFAGFNGGKAKVLGDNGLEVITNLYNKVTLAQGGVVVSGDTKTVTNAAALSGKSTAPVRLVDTDGDGNLDVAYVTAPIYGTVRSYNAERFDFSTAAKFNNTAITSGRNEDNFKNFTFASTIAAKDVIRIDVDVTSGEVLYTVTKLEPTVASLSHVYDKDGKIKVGGTDYGFYTGEFDGIAVSLTAGSYAPKLGKELTLYADGSYIFSATEGVSTTLGTNFAFVQGYNKGVTSSNGMTANGVKVQLVLADGKNVICDYVNNADTTNFYQATDIGDTFVGTIVEYKMDGSNVTFRKTPSVVADPSTNGIKYYDADVNSMSYTSTTGIFSRTGLSLKATEDSVFFLPSSSKSVNNSGKNVVIEKVSVIKGNELKGAPTMTPSATTGHKMDLIYAPKNGINTVAYAVLDTSSNLSESGTYAYTTTNSWQVTEDSKTTARVKAVLSDAADAEPVELILENNTDTAVGNKVYAVTKNSDGTYSLAKLAAPLTTTKALGSVSGITADGKTVSIDSGLYNTTSNTKVFVIDMATGAITLGEVSDITTADKDEGGTAYKNILCEYDSTSKNLSTVYVELYGNSVAKLISYGDGTKAVYTSSEQTIKTTGGTEGTKATYTSQAFTSASTTPGTNDSFNVIVGGKAYLIPDTNTSVKDQAAAWCTAYNEDTANDGWTAAADNTGAITITGGNSSSLQQTATGVTGGTWTPGDNGTQNATLLLTAAANPETTKTSSKFAVDIDGKTYEVAKTNTTAANQLTAWIAAYNEETANKYIAAKEGTNQVKLTEKTASTVTTNNTGMSGGTWTAGVAGTPGTPGGNLTIGGHTYAVKANEDTLAKQLAGFVADYNANATGKADWVASVHGDGDKVVFTAKVAGTLDNTGATAPTGTTETTPGAN